MASVRCRTRGCPHYTLEGYAKRRLFMARADDGTELADGVFCWRCRRKHTSPEDRKRAQERRKDGGG